jgi:hypothetical protein
MNTQFFSKCLSPAAQPLRPFERWGYGLLNAVLVGGSSAAVSALGLATAHGVGDTQVPVINLHIISIIFVSGAVSKFFIYLSQGLPGMEQGNGQSNNPAANPPNNNP